MDPDEIERQRAHNQRMAERCFLFAALLLLVGIPLVVLMTALGF